MLPAGCAAGFGLDATNVCQACTGDTASAGGAAITCDACDEGEEPNDEATACVVSGELSPCAVLAAGVGRLGKEQCQQ